ncbi:SGNH hydrolase-type esterase domain-containing protein [Aspergillus cavernicola]|uniref:SGNH hydrolase-type esterase domain-containing protein n=1 Tax=Aspergillus cavernicola TaxID=176166 RepID=A0ABR4I0N1_9EURO
MPFWLSLCIFAIFGQQALAYPTLAPCYNGTDFRTDLILHKRQHLENHNLRILPLGASITNGLKSTDKNGYRKHLRDALRWANYQVDMVGSLRNGTMKDNDNEGHSGFTIEEVHRMAQPQYRVKPNLVLINAGTNDCTQHVDEAYASGAMLMENMVVDIFNNIPEVTVILSGLLPNTARGPCTKFLNDEYGKLVEKLASQGRKIVFANFNTGWFTEANLIDDTHPNDYGYKMLASLWFDAIMTAADKGFLTDALDNGLPVGSTTGACDKTPGDYEYSKQTQRGSGGDDGPYTHKGVSQGMFYVIRPVRLNDVGKTIFWADLSGDGKDSLVSYYDPIDSKGSYLVYSDWDKAQADTGSYIWINVKDNCKPEGVRWGDVNGDGLDDFICIGPEGDMYVSVNRGGSPPTFEYLGLYHSNPRAESSQTHVRLGDIDGDGRLDYCLIAGNGDISCWRNGWIDDRAEYWQALGIVFAGKGKGDIDGVRLIDINGDGRADWLYVHDDGSVDTYINNRGHDKSLRPDWSNSGRTHAGMGEKGARTFVQFARLTSSGRADYIWQDPKKNENSEISMAIYLHWWRNDGSGGTRLKSDGNYYCDMTGDGLDDYIWVSFDGNFQIFRNVNDPPNWGQEGWVFRKTWDRKNIRIADIDGDGKCDLIFLSEGGKGEVVSWYKTDYRDGVFSFTNKNGLPGVGACKGDSQRDGVGLFDLAVRFADLKQCIDPDGRTFAMMSTETDEYKDMGQVKKPEGKDRANLRFIDINGDGKADMLWLDKFGGTAKVWYNEKLAPASGTASSMTWRPGGDAYLQSARGEAQYFANQRGTGRADMIDVNPRTNEATTYFSRDCGAGGSGDDGPSEDPGLPPVDQPSEETPGPTPPYPFPPFDKFIAMGDSYSAGIGAGDDVTRNDNWDSTGQCYRNQGAYSYQLWKTEPVLGYNNRGFDFLSCTGAVAKNMLSDRQFPHRRGPQLEMLQEITAAAPNSYGWATLSLGGNDLGFSKILVPCLIFDNPDSCSEGHRNAASLLRGEGPEGFTLRERFRQVYRGILNTARVPGFTLVVTGYAQFFNEVTNLCDTKSIGVARVLGLAAPKLLKAKRQQMNALVRSLNTIIKDMVQEVNAEFDDKHIRFFDIDPLFNGHRLCDTDPSTGAELSNWRTNAWFYTFYRNSDPGARLSTVAATLTAENDNLDDLGPVDLSKCPAEGTELDTELGMWCEMLREIDLGAGSGLPPRDLTDIIGSLFKTMHPKFKAHEAIMNGIINEWRNNWGREAPQGPPRFLSIEGEASN